jgi:hypothetical protein
MKKSLAQQNGLGLAFLHNLLRLLKGTAKLNTCLGDESNKYDLIVAPCF